VRWLAPFVRSIFIIHKRAHAVWLVYYTLLSNPRSTPFYHSCIHPSISITIHKKAKPSQPKPLTT
jgi:hypothetical protein